MMERSMYGRQEIERLKEAIDWLDLLRQLGFERINPANRRCCCKIHGGKNENSFSWNQRYFHCFACNRSGDAIDLVRAIENCSFREAVNILERLTGFYIKKSNAITENRSIFEREIPAYSVKKIENINYEKIDIERKLKEKRETSIMYSEILSSMRNDNVPALYDSIEKKLKNLDEDINLLTYEYKRL
ncbi:MAG: hypothetical protein GF353_02325 [Candidatus Lokiarchaeota archaeon]|nr:hypothetical protein [Candidatus Lokiarchaeota archaeon]